MQNNVLIGNGINIQFGGRDYTNRAIMKRAISNISSNKYKALLPEISAEELLDLLNSLRDIVTGQIGKNPSEMYLLLSAEMQRIRNTYDINTTLEDIALEDLFIAFEFLFEAEDTAVFRNRVHLELQQLILDAIFNDGKIQTITYGEGFRQFLSSYDNIFTINYDGNLERYTDKQVFHLHGSFDVLAPEYDKNSDYSKNNPDKCLASQIVSGFEHTYSNTVMSWNWLDKYGAWLEDYSYGKETFESIEGKLDIIGVSPCNDLHLFLTVKNSHVRSINYYYNSDNSRNNMQGILPKIVTYKKAKKLWECIHT